MTLALAAPVRAADSAPASEPVVGLPCEGCEAVFSQRANHEQGRGGGGLGVPTKEASGVWNVRCDIRLGENIPGYPPLR